MEKGNRLSLTTRITGYLIVAAAAAATGIAGTIMMDKPGEGILDECPWWTSVAIMGGLGWWAYTNRSPKNKNRNPT